MTFTQEVCKGYEVKSIEELFTVCYFFYPSSTRWQWEDVLDKVLAEAVMENSLTPEQARQIRSAVIDYYLEFLDDELGL